MTKKNVFRQLPRRLMRYFVISDPAAESLINGIIGCRSLIAIDGILRDAGVAEVDGIVRPVQPTPETRQSDFEASLVEESEKIITESQKSQLVRVAPVSTNGTLRGARVQVVSPKDRPQRSPSSNSESQYPSLPSTSHRSSFSISLVEDPLPDAGYFSLLGRVIDTGARMAFPTSGSHSIDTVASEPPFELLFSQSIFGSRSEDRNNRVGAAGELLVSRKLCSIISRITVDTRSHRSSKFFLVEDCPLSISKTGEVRSDTQSPFMTIIRNCWHGLAVRLQIWYIPTLTVC
jgi:hypothetical protein